MEFHPTSLEELLTWLPEASAEMIDAGDIEGGRRLLRLIAPIRRWMAESHPAPEVPEVGLAWAEVRRSEVVAPPASDGNGEPNPPGQDHADLNSPGVAPSAWLPNSENSARPNPSGIADIKRLRQFPKISSRAFQHPLDKQATVVLGKVPFLDTLLKFVSSAWLEKLQWHQSNAQCIRLGPKQGQSIYKKVEDAMVILDLPYRPDVFVSASPLINAYASGMKRFQITLFSGLLDLLTEEELLAVIGHELGHIKCNHMLYNQLALILRQGGIAFLNDMLPAGLGMLAGITSALAVMEWYRKAEFSCDRAALLVVQDPEIVARALTKMAGGAPTVLPDWDIFAVVDQAQEFEESDESLPAKLVRLHMLLGQTHPHPVLRVREILAWGKSPQFADIMDGNYEKEGRSGLLRFSEPVGLKCAQCGYINSTDARFCAKDGRSTKDAQRVCGHCQTPVSDSARSCPSCEMIFPPSS